MDAFKWNRLAAAIGNDLAVNLVQDFTIADGAPVRDGLIQKFGLPVNTSGQELLQELDSRQTVCPERADQDGFRLSEMLRKYDLRKSEWFYLNWHHFETVDKVQPDLLDRYFDDIWYPAADDLDIVANHFEWALSIDHEGYVKILIFDGIA